MNNRFVHDAGQLIRKLQTDYYTVLLSCVCLWSDEFRFVKRNVPVGEIGDFSNRRESQAELESRAEELSQG